MPNEFPSETTVGSKSNPPRGKVADKIAAEAKVSPYKVLKLIKLPPEQRAQVAKGEKRLRDIHFPKPPKRQPKKQSLRGSNLADVFGQPFETEVWRRFSQMIRTIALARHKDARAFLLRQLQGEGRAT
jgi:hypothetical protein